MATITPEVLQAKQQQIRAAASSTPAMRGKRLTGHAMSSAASDYVKVLGMGASNTGKTKALAGILRTTNRVGRPTKIFVASTDIGGIGLRSVREDLSGTNDSELLTNIGFYEFPHGESGYKEFNYFTSHPDAMDVTTGDGKVVSLWEFDPDVLSHEGIANFQATHVWSYVMSLTPLDKDAPEVRDEGLYAGRPEWGQILRETCLQIDKFNTIHNPNGKLIHKYNTVLLDNQGKEYKMSGETLRGPMLQGAAREAMAPAYDLILEMRQVKPRLGKGDVTYEYRCEIGGNTVAKNRGLPVGSVEPADMKTLWQRITTSITAK